MILLCFRRRTWFNFTRYVFRFIAANEIVLSRFVSLRSFIDHKHLAVMFRRRGIIDSQVDLCFAHFDKINATCIVGWFVFSIKFYQFLVEL